MIYNKHNEDLQNKHEFSNNIFLRHFTGTGCSHGEKEIVENIGFGINLKDTTELLRICNGSDLALFVVLLTSVKILFERYTNHNEVELLLPKYIDDLVKNDRDGYLIFQDTIDINLSVKENILMSKEKLMNVYTNQDYDLRKQYSLDEYKRILKETPICSLKNIHGQVENDYFFHISFWHNDCIECRIFYDNSMFQKDLVTNLSQQLEQIIIECIYSYNKLVKNVDIMSADSYTKIRSFSSGPKTKLLKLGLHNLFEEQVKLTPNQPAIIFENETISYAMLNNKANYFAIYLMELGVIAGSGIPLLLTRSINMAIAILGVMKAGCYFIP